MVGANAVGPGAGTGAAAALHWRGTPGMLQARGSEMARVWLTGTWKGMPPVAIEQRQYVLLPVRALSELQQPGVGEVPLALLLVTKLIQGVKLASIDGVQGDVVWP